LYGGLPDLLASALIGKGEGVEGIPVAVGLDSWHPTLGTRVTGQRNTAPRLVQRGARLEQVASPPPTGHWNFPEPIGGRETVMMPLSEIITLASHIKADSIQSWMNMEALRDIRDSATPPPQASDEIGRSPQRFVVEVVVNVGSEQRRAIASGRDIYFASAPIIVEAAQRQLAGGGQGPSGVHAIGAMFDPRAFLNALRPSGIEVDYGRSEAPLPMA